MKVTAALKSALQNYEPPPIPPQFRDHAKASVMVLVREGSRPTIVLTSAQLISVVMPGRLPGQVGEWSLPT